MSSLPYKLDKVPALLTAAVTPQWTWRMDGGQESSEGPRGPSSQALLGGASPTWDLLPRSRHRKDIFMKWKELMY